VKVRVKLFAIARQVVGAETVEVELVEGATVSELRRVLIGTYPVLATTMPLMMVAVAAEYATDQTVINANDEVALIPPVSGG
jgi:molybdopterin converting factor subunit 1